MSSRLVKARWDVAANARAVTAVDTAAILEVWGRTEGDVRSRSVRVEVRECGWRTDGPWRVVSALGFRHEGALLGRPFGVRSASTRAVRRAMVCHDTGSRNRRFSHLSHVSTAERKS